MAPKRVWMSPHTGNYMLHVLGGSLGIVLLAMLLIIGGTWLSDHGHNVLGYAAGTIETQEFLNRLAQMPYVPAGADEVLKVERIKDSRSCYAVSCQVRHPNRNVIRRSYFIVKGVLEETSLLLELEPRER